MGSDHRGAGLASAAIEEIRIEVRSQGDLALSMTLYRDGSISRQGSAALPMNEPPVMGMTDGSCFKELLKIIPEQIFSHAGKYHLPGKSGKIETQYLLAFLFPQAGPGADGPLIGFQLDLGHPSEIGSVPVAVKYVDAFVVKAVQITNSWYAAAMVEKT